MLLLGCLISTVHAAAASADCGGAMIDHPSGPMDRGASITVTGRAFGTGCYDTGPPPPGEGVLGEPRTSIELLVVQGDTEILVARGSADDDYSFTVDITVPSGLEPGEARIETRADGDLGRPAELIPTLLVTEAPAPPLEPEVAEFGPGGAPAPITTPSTPAEEPGVTSSLPEADRAGAAEDRSGLAVATIVGAALLVVAAAAAALIARRRTS
ncbi:hypothetical protein PO878_07740 [Iamia majanohamensis]|uniref:Uncharacterized protein n=1 Tax=Iamia majanohamensis TaxID=467976 RepID=A0AAF0BXE1_9ACTN|nr:hypothetical protein [Iamia majanohamensis]WCO68619.1 hypothetical protein PO878_07740 [Iamia majanohamensis]